MADEVRDRADEIRGGGTDEVFGGGMAGEMWEGGEVWGEDEDLVLTGNGIPLSREGFLD